MKGKHRDTGKACLTDSFLNSNTTTSKKVASLFSQCTDVVLETVFIQILVDGRVVELGKSVISRFKLDIASTQIEYGPMTVAELFY